MTVREKIERYVDDLLAEHGVQHVADREELVDDVHRRFCRYCELRDDCDLCHSVETTLERELSDYLEG